MGTQVDVTVCEHPSPYMAGPGGGLSGGRHCPRCQGEGLAGPTLRWDCLEPAPPCAGTA